MIETQSTIFERVWANPSGHLFHSDRHQVMAIADVFGKLPLQLVIAPSQGKPGEIVHFADLPRATRRKLHEVSDAFDEKLLEQCTPDQRVITHVEGFGVPDHAHIVKFIAERKQGQDLYTGAALGELAVRHTVELLTLSVAETLELENQLDTIS